MAELTQDVLEALKLAAGLAGLGLLLLALGGFLVATYRVAVRGRPLVLPFRGTDDRRAELAGLFTERVIEIENGWVRRAARAVELKDEFHRRAREAARSAPAVDSELLARGRALPDRLTASSVDRRALAAVGMAPRTAGGDFLHYVVDLGETNSLADADFGTVAVAGVSFSPQQLIALFRQLPQVFARRLISGKMVEVGGRSVLAVHYDEKWAWGGARRVRRIASVEKDDWLTAIEKLAFELEKGRVELRRDRLREREELGDRIRARLRLLTANAHLRETATPGVPHAASGSETADRALIEAESWAACQAFLDGYALHLEHYLSGNAADRDNALEAYTEALHHQPAYARAQYNRATLLYNRYLADENKRAIDDFKAASRTADPNDRALALSGLVMAYGQKVHRFNTPAARVKKDAARASEEALTLAPHLEETHFARGWALQIDERWEKALEAYEAVAKLESEPTAPGERMKSFAENNAAWILLMQVDQGDLSLRRAESLLWSAVARYPNKIAYANLAEVAKRRERFEDAERLFDSALALDPEYVRGWHELALLQLDRARRAAVRDDASSVKTMIAKARANQARAKRIAADAETRVGLADAFEEKLRAVAAARRLRRRNSA